MGFLFGAIEALGAVKVVTSSSLVRFEILVSEETSAGYAMIHVRHQK